MNLGTIKLKVFALRTKLTEMIKSIDSIEKEFNKNDRKRVRCPKCGVRDVRINLNGIVCRACGFSSVPKKKAGKK